MEGGDFMENVIFTYDRKANKLVITVDLAKELGRSKSGKSIVVASTQGNVKLEDGVTFLGLNVYRKA